VRWSPGSFAMGFFTALLVFAGALFLVLHGVTNDGLTVQLDPAPVAEKLEGVVAEEAGSEIEILVRSVRRDLPSQVASEVAGSFDQLTLKIYDVEVPLPDAVIDRLEEELRQSLAEEMESWVDNLEWEDLVVQLTERTEEGLMDVMQNSSLMEFAVDLPGWWQVPVRIVPEIEEDAQRKSE